MKKEFYEPLAIITGGMATAFAVFLAIVEMVHEKLGIWAAPLVALICWREYILTGLRLELERHRSD